MKAIERMLRPFRKFRKPGLSALEREKVRQEAVKQVMHPHASLMHAPPYKLGEKQKIFPRLFAELILYAYRKGFQITLAEAHRPPELAELYAKQGRGIAKSLHTQRLAVDINLFKGGRYLRKTEDYRPLGLYWESLSTPGLECCWGGDFKDAKGNPKPDGGHFSISHGGRK